MLDYVDMQYVNLISSRLNRFSIKHRNPLKCQMRCPFCGDSKKSEKKARGWLIENDKSSSLMYICFNCGITHSFNQFLKLQDQNIYHEYIAEKYLNKDKKIQSEETTKKEEKKPYKNVLSSIMKISQLKADHPVKKYVEQRSIPSNQHYRIFYAPKFKTWINSIIPDKFPPFKRDEPRLILPFIGKDGKVFGVSARGFDPNGLRYISIMFDDRPKIFGLDKVDFNKPYLIVEGAIDSLFLDNCIAMAGADGNIEGLEQLENATFVFDIENRNSQIVNRMEKLLNRGYNVCIWPSSVKKNGKDINELVLNGLQPVQIQNIIRENTFSGLEGQLKLASWRKS
jgi:transcription elongation factor Elf1